MLRSIKNLTEYKVESGDEDHREVGSVKDFLIDEEGLNVRYMTVYTGSWLFGREVLLAPSSIEVVDGDRKIVRVRQGQEQVEKAPDVGAFPPISRRDEEALAMHYGWPLYWMTPSQSAGVPPLPHARPEGAGDAPEPIGESGQAAEMRRAHVVLGIEVHTADGKIGRVSDLIADDRDWSVTLLVVPLETLEGKRKVVLVELGEVERIEWKKPRVLLQPRLENLKKREAYNPETPVNYDVEERVYDFHGRLVHAVRPFMGS